MKHFAHYLGLTFLVSCLSASGAHAGDAEVLAHKILDAQGGAKAWRDAQTISFEHELVFGGQGKPWLSKDVVDLATRRVYQDWPNHGSKLSYDGKDVWTVDWSLGNPPKVMPYLTFNSITAPWLLLHEGVEIENAGREELPGDDVEYQTVTLRLPQDHDKPPVATYYKLYADPESFELKATAYAVNYGALLDTMGIPAGVEEVGPMIHVFDEWAEVDGVRLPTRYHTVGPDGTVYGQHTVRDWKLGVKFDEGRMKRPDDAVVDTSSHLRKGSGN